MVENTWSIFQCGFRKQHSTQHALIAMTEKARKILGKGGTFVALLTDLSKAFGCMTHYFLIAKLQALNIDINALNLMFGYLTGRKQRLISSSCFSSCLDLFQRVLQGSILRPLLLDLLLCELFLIEEADIKMTTFCSWVLKLLKSL